MQLAWTDILVELESIAQEAQKETPSNKETLQIKWLLW